MMRGNNSSGPMFLTILYAIISLIFLHPLKDGCEAFMIQNTFRRKQLARQQFLDTSSTSLSSIRPQPRSRSSTSRSKSTPQNESGVISSLISNLAVIALKLRLASHTSVTCNVSASSSQLLLNKTVGPVSVQGRDWSSPLGLTCRAIKADVEECLLDMNSVISRRKLILTKPAVGNAMIAFNQDDFGSFLKHPLLQAQLPRLSSTQFKDNDMNGDDKERTFEFRKDGTTINGDNEGYVIFYGECMGQCWKCKLKRSANEQNKAEIIIRHDGSLRPSSKELTDDVIKSLEIEFSTTVTTFFNDLVFELDGTFLSFKDIKIHSPSKKKDLEPRILFALDIIVKKFPSPGLAF